MHEILETRCFYRTAQNLEPNPICWKGKMPGKLFSNETEGLRRRGSDAIVANLFFNQRSLVRRKLPACSYAVENLDSPQHDNDGRYQRGRRQYTF